MASLIHLDTHVMVWLYLPQLDLLSARARDILETSELEASPATMLELEFLREIGRLRVGGHEVFQSLHTQLGLRLSTVPFGRVVESSLSQGWTRDPFDRLIVGHASAAGAELVTRDDAIRANFDGAVW